MDESGDRKQDPWDRISYETPQRDVFDPFPIRTDQSLHRNHTESPRLALCGNLFGNVDSVIDTIQLFAETGQRGVSLRAEGG